MGIVLSSAFTSDNMIAVRLYYVFQTTKPLFSSSFSNSCPNSGFSVVPSNSGDTFHKSFAAGSTNSNKQRFNLSTEELLNNINSPFKDVLQSLASVKNWKVKSFHSMPRLSNRELR